MKFRWLRKLYWNNSAFSETCRFDHIKSSYYAQKNVRSRFIDAARDGMLTIFQVNPTLVVPLGPIPNILPL